MKALLENATNLAVTEISVPYDLPGSRSVPAADAAALSLVFLLSFCVVCFAWGAAVLSRREKQITHAAPELPDAAPDRERLSDPGAPKPSPAAWEREPDWWKKPT